jgi:hypothetical protein
VAILNPDHLFEQASNLIASSATGRPRQVDLRRAISAAYYGVFHAVLTAAADQAVGSVRRASEHYGLVYRSVSHRGLRELCQEVQKPVPSARYRRYQPVGGFSRNVRTFAAGLVQLQDARHSADYDPLVTLKRSDALFAVRLARRAVGRFKRASLRNWTVFLTLLLFPPR